MSVGLAPKNKKTTKEGNGSFVFIMMMRTGQRHPLQQLFTYGNYFEGVLGHYLILSHKRKRVPDTYCNKYLKKNQQLSEEATLLCLLSMESSFTFSCLVFCTNNGVFAATSRLLRSRLAGLANPYILLIYTTIMSLVIVSHHQESNEEQEQWLSLSDLLERSVQPARFLARRHYLESKRQQHRGSSDNNNNIVVVYQHQQHAQQHAPNAPAWLPSSPQQQQQHQQPWLPYDVVTSSSKALGALALPATASIPAGQQVIHVIAANTADSSSYYYEPLVVLLVVVLVLSAAGYYYYYCVAQHHQPSKSDDDRCCSRNNKKRMVVPRSISMTSVNTSMTATMDDSYNNWNGDSSSLPRTSSRVSLLTTASEFLDHSESSGSSDSSSLGPEQQQQQQGEEVSYEDHVNITSLLGLDCNNRGGDDRLPSVVESPVRNRDSPAASPTTKAPVADKRDEDEATVTSFLGDITEPLHHHHPQQQQQPTDDDLSVQSSPERRRPSHALVLRSSRTLACQEVDNVGDDCWASEDEWSVQSSPPPTRRLPSEQALVIRPSRSLTYLEDDDDISDYEDEASLPHSPAQRKRMSQALVHRSSRSLVTGLDDTDAISDQVVEDSSPPRRSSQALVRRSSRSLVAQFNSEETQKETVSPRRSSRALTRLSSRSVVVLKAGDSHPDQASPPRRRRSSQALVIPPFHHFVTVDTIDSDNQSSDQEENEETIRRQRRRSNRRRLSQDLARLPSHTFIRTDSSSTLGTNNGDLVLRDGSVHRSPAKRRRSSRRSSLMMRSSGDSVSTMDTDVDLDVDLGLVSTSLHNNQQQQLMCLDESHYLTSDDDSSSSYESDGSSETEISLSQLALPSSRSSRGKGGGVIMADVLTLPRSSSSPKNGGTTGDRRLLTLDASTNMSRHQALPASASAVTIVGKKKKNSRKSPKKLTMGGTDAPAIENGALVLRQCDDLLQAYREEEEEDDDYDSDSSFEAGALVPRGSSALNDGFVEDDGTDDEERDDDALLLIDPVDAVPSRRNRSASVKANELSLLMFSSSSRSLMQKKKKRRRGSRRKSLLAADGEFASQLVEVGDHAIISNIDMLPGSSKAKPSVQKHCIDKKDRQRLKNARLVLRVVLGSGRKDYKTAKGCFDAIDQVVAFKQQMMMVVQEVAKGSQVLADIKELWAHLLQRGEEPLLFPSLPVDEESLDAYEKSLHLLQQIQLHIHPGASTQTSENTYTKVADFTSEDTLLESEEADTTILGFVDGLPVRLTLGGIDSRASIRSRLTPYKYDRQLPLSLQDALRVVRCILGPTHKRVSGSDCLRSIQMYALLQIQSKRISKQLAVERLFFQQLNKDMQRLCDSLDAAFTDRSPDAIRTVAKRIQRITKVLNEPN